MGKGSSAFFSPLGKCRGVNIHQNLAGGWKCFFKMRRTKREMFKWTWPRVPILFTDNEDEYTFYGTVVRAAIVLLER